MRKKNQSKRCRCGGPAHMYHTATPNSTALVYWCQNCAPPQGVVLREEWMRPMNPRAVAEYVRKEAA